MLSFAPSCDSGYSHRVLRLNIGLLIVSCEAGERFGLSFFTLRGENPANIEFAGLLVLLHIFVLVSKSCTPKLAMRMDIKGLLMVVQGDAKTTPVTVH
jgi:hypothetical protein